ncbi:MAG: hypothetical protein WD380_03220 [Gaiellaceae bacterium]
MRSYRAPMALALAAVALVSAVVVVVLAWNGGDAADDASSMVSPDVEAQASLSPRIALFGDTIKARVDVTLDQTLYDVGSVRVATTLAPWEIVGKPERARRDVGATTHLSTTFVLRCLTDACTPVRAAAPLDFIAARVTYRELGDESAKRESIEVDWPQLVAYSRIIPAESEVGTSGATISWRADVVSLPGVSYRVSPGIVLVLLLAGGLGLAAAGVGLAYVAWPRRALAPPPKPAPDPLPSLTPLEQALVLLGESARADGAGEQRRALELVAEELAKWGDADLSRAARMLAWSPDVPAVEQTTALAARVRAELDQALMARADLDGNGDGDAV